MFSLFKSPETPEALQKKAKQAYDKVAALTAETLEARSLRRGMSVLCCAHLDKTFIAGAEKTADWQQMAAFALTKNTPPPPLPSAEEFQSIRSGKADIWVYLPIEYADRAFMFGAKYQRTELSLEQAITSMQQLADLVCRTELGMDTQVTVLKFLRQELSQADRQSDVQEDLGESPLP
jgi:hypothetical protein